MTNRSAPWLCNCLPVRESFCVRTLSTWFANFAPQFLPSLRATSIALVSRPLRSKPRVSRRSSSRSLPHQGQAKGIGLARTPAGFVFAPLRNGEVIPPEQFAALPDEERKGIEAAMTSVQELLQSVTHQVLQLEKEGREKLKALTHDVTIFAVGHLIETLREKYATSAQVVVYLNAFQQDVIENVDQFLTPPEANVATWMGASRSLLDGPPSSGATGSTWWWTTARLKARRLFTMTIPLIRI